MSTLIETNLNIETEPTDFILPGKPLLRWPAKDRTEPHQRAGLSAGFLSSTEVSCLPEDRQSPAGWQW